MSKAYGCEKKADTGKTPWCLPFFAEIEVGIGKPPLYGNAHGFRRAFFRSSYTVFKQ